MLCWGADEKVAVRSTPPPDEGFRLVVSGDFDEMMRQAPALDPDDRAFHEGNAYFWYETLFKLYLVSSQSSRLPREIQPLLAAPLDEERAFQRDTADNLRRRLSLIEAFEPKSRNDDFLKRYAVAYFSSELRWREIITTATTIYASLRDPVSKDEMEKSAAIVREKTAETRQMLYEPGDLEGSGCCGSRHGRH